MTVAERMRRHGFAWCRLMGWTATLKGRFVLVNEYGFVIPDRFDGDSRACLNADGRSVVSLALLAKAAARKLARQRRA